MKNTLIILGMLLLITTLFVSCTTDDLTTEPQGLQEINTSNGQTNIDPKKGGD